MIKNKSQRQAVLTHLQLHKKISSKEAFELYGITRLSSIIFVLKDRGYIIETEMEQTTTRYGTTANYAVYKYIGEVDRAV